LLPSPLPPQKGSEKNRWATGIDRKKRDWAPGISGGDICRASEMAPGPAAQKGANGAPAEFLDPRRHPPRLRAHSSGIFLDPKCSALMSKAEGTGLGRPTFSNLGEAQKTVGPRSRLPQSCHPGRAFDPACFSPTSPEFLGKEARPKPPPPKPQANRSTHAGGCGLAPPCGRKTPRWGSQTRGPFPSLRAVFGRSSLSPSGRTASRSQGDLMGPRFEGTASNPVPLHRAEEKRKGEYAGGGTKPQPFWTDISAHRGGFRPRPPTAKWIAGKRRTRGTTFSKTASPTGRAKGEPLGLAKDPMQQEGPPPAHTSSKVYEQGRTPPPHNTRLEAGGKIRSPKAPGDKAGPSCQRTGDGDPPPRGRSPAGGKPNKESPFG